MEKKKLTLTNPKNGHLTHEHTVDSYFQKILNTIPTIYYNTPYHSWKRRNLLLLIRKMGTLLITKILPFPPDLEISIKVKKVQKIEIEDEDP